MLEQQAEVPFERFGVLSGHQDIVNVDENEVQTLADDVNQALEGLGSILQAEGHSDQKITPPPLHHNRIH